MIDTKILSQNKDAGITQLWHEHTDGSVTIETKQDITDIIENNKATYNNVDGRANWKGEMHKVGSIPMSIYHELQKQGILQDPKRLKKWLNDPSNQVFRTRPGKV